jgi:hypothetical protein
MIASKPDLPLTMVNTAGGELGANAVPQERIA